MPGTPTMNVQRLGKQLAREFARNRAKTAALGSLSLVAIYMWAPLLGRFVGWENKESRSEEVVAETTVSAEAEPAADDWDWPAVRQLMDEDERMRTATLLPGLRNPFIRETPLEPLVKSPETAPELPQVSALPPPEITPAHLGLELRGTVIGARARSANIGGINYREGDTVLLTGRQAAEAEAADVALDQVPSFQLVTIAQRFVVLERLGKHYRLELDPRSRSPQRTISIRVTH